MALTTTQILITILIVTLATVITRFLPFIIFKGDSSEDSYIRYLGKVLPYSAIGLLVVYCLRNINFTTAPNGLPEAIAIISIIILHYWKENTLLSIGVGTVIYMVLVQAIFV